MRLHLLYLVVFASGLCVAQGQANQPVTSSDASAAAHEIPIMDGAAGSCSLALTVTADNKPVYAANVKVHIAYGFGGLHKLDQEASSNVDGKVKFTGIPAKVRRPPLGFQVKKDDLTGTIDYDPTAECQAIHTVVLKKEPVK